MLAIGTVLTDRYELLEQIGAGGMSVVFRGLDHKLNREVAVKVMREDFTNDQTQVQNFRKEAMAIAMLNHPNIVGVYDIGNEEGLEYMVKEYVDGITLKEYIRRRRHLTSDEIVKITTKIAEALRAAHEVNIIHRDIKPQNILVTPKGEVKVTDFGIAKLAKSTTVTDQKEAMGSVHYLSPEQARGTRVDTRTDLYSLGITMYEMATGHTPYDGDTPVAVALKQIHDPLPAIRSEVPDIWSGLEAIIIGLTRKDPQERYQTAEEVLADLRQVYRDPGHGAIDHPAAEEQKPSGASFAGVFSNPVGNSSENEASGLSGKNGKKEKTAAGEKSDKVEKGTKKDTGSLNRTSSGKSRKDTADHELGYVPYTGLGSDTGYLDKKNEPKKSKKKEKDPGGSGSSVVMPILGTILGILIIALAVVIMLGIRAMRESRNATYSVPDFRGKTVIQAETEAALSKMNLVLEDDPRQAFSDDYEKGKIIEQSPAGGTQARSSETTTVSLVVSKGKRPVNLMDEYYGMEYEDLVKKLSDCGYAYHIDVVVTEDPEEAGKVVDQSPDPDTELDPGSELYVTVAYISEELTEVPLITGMEEHEALDLLLENDLTAGTVTESFHSSQPEGMVIGQNLKEGSLVPKGSEVSMTLSLGPYEGDEIQVAGAYLMNEELLGTIENESVWVYAYAIVNGEWTDLLDQQYTREEIRSQSLYLKYYKGTSEIHVLVDDFEVFTQTDME